MLKSFLELAKQALLYYKIHHFSLANVDAKFSRFYQNYDEAIDTLMPERTAVQRKTLHSDTFRMILEKGITSS